MVRVVVRSVAVLHTRDDASAGGGGAALHVLATDNVVRACMRGCGDGGAARGRALRVCVTSPPPQPASALGGVPPLPPPSLVRGAAAALLTHCAVHGVRGAAFVAGGAGPRASMEQLSALAAGLGVALVAGAAPSSTLGAGVAGRAPGDARAALLGALATLSGGAGGGMHM